MKAYVKEKKELPEFLHPKDMKAILEYLEAHGNIQVSAEQVEGYYMMFSEAIYGAAWIGVGLTQLAEFADYLSQVEVDPAHCTGDACIL